MSDQFTGKRVTVMGLGRFGGGVAVTRWLTRQGARVTISDKLEADALRQSLEQIADLDVTLHLGGHVEADFTEADLIVANPAVPPSAPALAWAGQAGVPVTTEINLFAERCPAPVVAVTGTVGKSTTTAMIGHVLQEALAGRGVFVGGNIGKSLLDVLPEITADDVVVLELSSFQLHYTPAIRWSPHIAVITNVTPNHLDWHGSHAAYLADKLNIVRFQDPARDVIIIEDVEALRHNFSLMFGDVAGLWRYGCDGDDLVAVMQSASAIDCDDQRLRWKAPRLAVPGEHNRRNAAAALTVAAALDVPADATAAALATFPGLPHRLCRVATVHGVTYYDDSKSTTPEAVMTALEALPGGVCIILGGYDKQVDLSAAAAAVAGRTRFAACIGQTRQQWHDLVQQAGGTAEMFETFEQAIEACQGRAQAGDSVLLSPGCASWGMFTDYRERGVAFAEYVQRGG